MATHIELVVKRGRFADVTDNSSGCVERVSYDEGNRLAAIADTIDKVEYVATVEELAARDRVDELMASARLIEKGAAWDEIYAQVRAIKRAFPRVFSDEPTTTRPYDRRTIEGWIVSVAGAVDQSAPIYIGPDEELNLTVLKTLDVLSDQGFKLLNISEERSVVHSAAGSEPSVASTKVEQTRYLMRRE